MSRQQPDGDDGIRRISLPATAAPGLLPGTTSTRTGADGGSGALARALDRWRRVVRPEQIRQPAAVASPPVAPATPAGDAESVAGLARRLDDSGCSYGRVSAAKLEHVIRAYDRLETKLNAVLMAVTGTFLSTLVGLLLYYVRGGSQ